MSDGMHHHCCHAHVAGHFLIFARHLESARQLTRTSPIRVLARARRLFLRCSFFYLRGHTLSFLAHTTVTYHSILTGSVYAFPCTYTSYTPLRCVSEEVARPKALTHYYGPPELTTQRLLRPVPRSDCSLHIILTLLERRRDQQLLAPRRISLTSTSHHQHGPAA